mgnify:CR=1 FL=1
MASGRAVAIAPVRVSSCPAVCDAIIAPLLRGCGAVTAIPVCEAPSCPPIPPLLPSELWHLRSQHRPLKVRQSVRQARSELHQMLD